MKNNCIVLFILCLFAFNLSFGQTEKIAEGIELTWGKEDEGEKKRSLQKIIGTDENHIYMLRQRSEVKQLTWQKEIIYSIQTYDKEGNLEMAKEIPNVQEGKEKYIGFDDVLYFNNRIFFFTSFFDKKQKTLTLYVQEIEKHSLELIGQPKKITTVKHKKRRLRTAIFLNKYYSGDFIYKISPNQEMVAILDSDNFERNDNDSFDVRVLDKELNLLYETKFTTSTNDVLFKAVDFEIDNKGDLFLLGMQYSDERFHSNKCMIFKYTDKGLALIKYTLNLGEVFVGGVKFEVMKNGDIVCTGFYSTDEKVEEKTIEGTFYQKINANESTNVYSPKIQKFSTDFFSEFMSEKRAKSEKKNKKIHDFIFNDFFVKEDGSALLIAERHYISTSNDASGKSSRASQQTIKTHYSAIIVVDVSKDGEIVWTRKIPKRQSSCNVCAEASNSYIVMFTDKQTYIVFNTMPDGIILNLTGLFTIKTLLITLSNQDGSIETNELFN